LPIGVNRWLRVRLVIERTCRNNHSCPAARQMRHGRATTPAECRGETPRGGKVVANDLALALCPAKRVWFHDRVRGMRGACRLSAARAMAIVKMVERLAHFICDRAAEAASLKRHGAWDFPSIDFAGPRI